MRTTPGNAACAARAGRRTADLCPTCRAPVRVSDEENFKRLRSLVHDRTPGRHTPHARINLGLAYQGGKGVAQDHAEAARWYRTAAGQGYARAQHNLGIMYMQGKGVEQDHTEANRWYRKAAEQGHAGAQHNLGTMHINGSGVGQDYAEAARWFRTAAEQGHAEAQVSLGTLHARGLGTPPDLRQAAAWWRKAAAQGNASASTNLEHLPHMPLGTPGMPVVVTGLAASPQFNGRAGLVQGPASKPGRLAVLLDGDSKPPSRRPSARPTSSRPTGSEPAAFILGGGGGPGHSSTGQHQACRAEGRAHPHWSVALGRSTSYSYFANTSVQLVDKPCSYIVNKHHHLTRRPVPLRFLFILFTFSKGKMPSSSSHMHDNARISPARGTERQRMAKLGHSRWIGAVRMCPCRVLARVRTTVRVSG